MKKPLLFLTLLLPALGFGQGYSLKCARVTSGGSTTTGGSYRLLNTIGQPDAGGPITSGRYVFTGGFWAQIVVVPTPGLPLLSIAQAGDQINVAWPATGSYTLEQNNDLAAPAGWTVSSYPATTAHGTNTVTIHSPVGNWYFRLRQ